MSSRGQWRTNVERSRPHKGKLTLMVEEATSRPPHRAVVRPVPGALSPLGKHRVLWSNSWPPTAQMITGMQRSGHRRPHRPGGDAEIRKQTSQRTLIGKAALCQTPVRAAVTCRQ